jgi:DNA-binding response OmpR family regulator
VSEISMTWPQYRRGCCLLDGEQVYLTPTQTEIIAVLLVRRGCVIEREDLWEWVWPNPDAAPDMKNIDVQVCKLRQRLGGVIENEWGRGYRIPLPGHEAGKLHYRDLRHAA